MLATVVGFVILVAAGAVFYFVGQDALGWLVAVFASGMAGVITAEFVKKEAHRARPDTTGPGNGPDADPGGGGPVPDDLGDHEQRPDLDRGGPDDRRDVERRGRRRTVHRGRSSRWELFFGFRRYRR